MTSHPKSLHHSFLSAPLLVANEKFPISVKYLEIWQDKVLLSYILIS